jgi:hypothetical protein
VIRDYTSTKAGPDHPINYTGPAVIPDRSALYTSTAAGPDRPVSYQDTAIGGDFDLAEPYLPPGTITYVPEIRIETQTEIKELIVHQARNPMWLILYVYVDLWTIFISHFVYWLPGPTRKIKSTLPTRVTDPLFSLAITEGETATDPVPTIADTFPKSVIPRPEGISEIDASQIPIPESPFSPEVDASQIPIPASPFSPEVDPSQVPIPASPFSPGVDTLEVPAAASPAAPAKVIRKLPPLLPNLFLGIIGVVVPALFPFSLHIFHQRHIWLSANEVTRLAVTQYYNRGERGPTSSSGGQWAWQRYMAYWVIKYWDIQMVLPG